MRSHGLFHQVIHRSVQLFRSGLIGGECLPTGRVAPDRQSGDVMCQTHLMRQTMRRMTVPSWPSRGPAAMLLSAALVVSPGGLIGHAALTSRPAVFARLVATNTIVVTGKYSGTLKLEDPAKNCVELINDPKKQDVIRLNYSGKLSGLSGTKWTFIAAEKGSGTFTQSHISTTKAPLFFSSTTGIGFTAISGTITIGGKAGSFKYKVTWSNQPGSIGAASMGSGTATGSWSCPAVETI